MNRHEVSPVRIAGYTTAISLHAVALLLLTLPGGDRQLFYPEAEAVTQIRFIPTLGKAFRPVPPAPPPAPVQTPTPRKSKASAATPTPPTPVVEVAEVPVESTHLVTVLEEEDAASAMDLPQPDSPPSEILSFRSSNPPVYPPEAIAAGDAGWVTLRVLIDVDGTPLTFILASSTATERLVEAAIAAVKQWRFNPAMKDGQPVPAWIDVPIGFYNQRHQAAQAVIAPGRTNGS